MLQTVNWVILPNGMMQNTLQLIMPQVCHITCSAILPALTLCGAEFAFKKCYFANPGARWPITQKYMKTKEELYMLSQEIEDVQEKLVLKFKKFCEKDMFAAEDYIQYCMCRTILSQRLLDTRIQRTVLY